MSVDPQALAAELLAGLNFGHLGTVNRDGSVQVSPVWVHIEDGRPVFNTAEGRVKWRNIERDPRVTLEVIDSSGYRSVEIRGRAVMTREGAREHADELAMKYTGEPFDNFVEGVERVKVTIEPERYLFHH
ncbi:MAG TPA: TIGR03618 family F420-dependent PPOX class oxidoreductase [Gaiellales bacterium]|nr:TIGR03618 family F420-dependent PPOX class oxidoreductase [Gaiellales bacterium]HSS54677.1 TIGR03618 family F420-dependent PPOX class oxidoreductase [Gaiellales bacterium]